MAAHLHDGNWVFAGDWNMTEFFDDSVGPSPKLHGSEEQSWKRMIDSLDHIDHYLSAAVKKGSIFTRELACGNCFDQSRLDCIYSSNRGSWHAYVKLLEHDNRQVLSDHIPVMTCIELIEPPAQGRRKCLYLKMDHSYLEDPAFKEQIWVTWEQALNRSEDVDLRVTWEHTWKAVKRSFAEGKKRRKLVALESSAEVRQIQSLRDRLAIQHDLKLLCGLTALEAVVHVRERRDAVAWRRRSRVRWLAIDDAPSRYFFA